MPVQFVISSPLNLVFVRCTGRVDVRQFGRCMQHYSGSPHFGQRMDLCVAVDEDAHVDIATGELSRVIAPISGRIRSHGMHFRVAFILPKEEHIAPMVEGFRGLASGAETGAFHNVGEALKWIGHSRGEDLGLQLWQDADEKRAL